LSALFHTVLAAPAYLVTTVFVVLPSVVILTCSSFRSERSWGSFTALLKDLALLGIGLAAYGAVFAFIGAYFKYPLVTGLVFAFGWEQLALLLPGYLRRLTIAYYLQALVPHSMPQEGLVGALQALFREVAPVWVSLVWLAGYVVFIAPRGLGTVERGANSANSSNAATEENLGCGTSRGNCRLL
jgi:hypothetical protein